MKRTIFFSMSNDAVFRNMALVPGGVLDELSKNAELRIIIGTKMTDLPYCHTGPADVVIEPLVENMRRPPLARFFHFCYSYLLFTDTTRLVSSYGVRADTPRPWWRYYNYPLKLFLGKILGRSVWVKKTLVPKLYFLFIRSRPYRYLFEKYHFDLAFLPNVCLWPADLEFLVEAKRSGVRTVGMPGNWDHLSKYFIPFRADTLLVWSNETAEEAVMYQLYDPTRVKKVGAPQADFFVRADLRSTRADFLRSIGFLEDTFLLTYASQGPYSVDGPDYIDMLLVWIAEEKLPHRTRVIIRIHPRAVFERERFAKFRGNPLIYFDGLEGWTSIPNARNYNDVIGHADVLITTYSTVATEASVWDRPTIITSFDGYKERPMYQSVRRHRAFTHFQGVIATGGVRIVESPEEFLAALQAYEKNPLRDAAGRARLRREVFGELDGKSATRVSQEIIKNSIDRAAMP